ncbi:hypothetical protein EBU99_08520 [bacterium]|nr:hypothetical protein [bacterium]
MGFLKRTSRLRQKMHARYHDALLQTVLHRAVHFFCFLLLENSAFAQDAAKKDAASAQAAPTAKAGNCPAPTSSAESPSRLRVVSVSGSAKKFKIKLDKGGKSIGLPAPAGEQTPNVGDCFYVLADNQKDVVAEIVFQKATKNAKGISVWAFSPNRRSEAGKLILNLNAVRVSETTSNDADSSGGGELLPGENPLVLPSFVLIQNAQHQAANVRTGYALNIPVSGFGVEVDAFVPRLATGTWTNMIGLRLNFLSWSAEKFVFRKVSAGDNQDATATGNNLQLDLVFRYPLQNKFIPRIGFFVSPLAKQTEILKAEASALSPQNTQTVVRSGLLFGAEAEIQPANNFFLQGRMTMSSKEATSVQDQTTPGETLSGTGSVARLHLTGIAGVRLPITASRRFVFEGLVGNTYRSDKYSPEISNGGQDQQKDIVTFFQAGFGYIL